MTTETKAPAKPKAPKKIEVLLYRDYWDETGARHGKGGVVAIPEAQAKGLIQANKAIRAEDAPEPGEGSE